MQNYSKIQKFFHNFVFKKKVINDLLYEFEKILFLRYENFHNHSHLFISSLPRSGTTSLLNFFYSSNKYASLTYRNMPFLLSPNISKLINKKNISEKKRLHDDGIKYDIDSPEAFDEIFFNKGEKFINEELLKYINLIMIAQKKNHYLSKNNLNFKRINLIQKLLPNAIFLVPIREPLQQANSLLNQHLLFCNLQKKDDFIQRYMNFLSHNEFGLDHRFWNKPIKFKDCNDINYWLEQWLLFYYSMLKKHELTENCFFLIYEYLNNSVYIKKFLSTIKFNDLKKVNLNFFKNSNKSQIKLNYDKNLYNDAINIYNQFLLKNKKFLDN